MLLMATQSKQSDTALGLQAWQFLKRQLLLSCRCGELPEDVILERTS
jgi:hypothetical protein